MMYNFIARQPIFKKNLQIYGYEFLFRDSIKNAAPLIDGDIATSRVLSTTFITNDFYKYTEGRKAFINFTRNLIVNEIPLIFPNKAIVVEILENVRADDEVIKACKNFVQKGYLIALDDFIYDPDLKPLIDLADIIKIDFRQTSPETMKNYIGQLRKYKKIFLAEKVETYKEFRSALSLGFDYFQGYFFSKPEIIKERKLQTSKINLLLVICEINRKKFNLDQLEKFISHDVVLSYKLLRYVNSAYYRRISEIKSVKQALILLGEVEIKRFIAFMAMTKLSEGKPTELIKVSSIRAKFCELLGSHMEMAENIDELFTLGLFSLLDAIMDNSMENIMKRLPLSKSIKNALILGKGPLKKIFSLAKFYEKGDWRNVKLLSGQMNINEDKLPDLYLKAVEWGNSLSSL